MINKMRLMANTNPKTERTEINDLTHEVIGLAMKVHRTLGSGFLESVYQEALKIEPKATGLEFLSQHPLKVTYQDRVVGEFTTDLIVESRLVLELKAISNLANVHEVQLVNYLTATGIEDGLLLNFGGPSLQFKRKFKTHPTTQEIPDLQA